MIDSDEVLGGEDRLGFQNRADLRVDLALDGFVLGGGFDDQIHRRQVVDVVRAADQHQRLAALLVGHLAVGDLAGQVAVDGGEAGFDAILGDVVNMDLVSSRSRDMGDTAAHLTRADNSDIPDHMPSLVVRSSRHALSPKQNCRAVKTARQN